MKKRLKFGTKKLMKTGKSRVLKLISKKMKKRCEMIDSIIDFDFDYEYDYKNELNSNDLF